MYSVVWNCLVGHCVQCSREWSWWTQTVSFCWTLTVTVYSVSGNGLVGHRQRLFTVVVNSLLGHLQRLCTV